MANPPQTRAAAREAKLAAALRENLRRRKAQARARAEAPKPPPETEPDAPPELDAPPRIG